MDKKRRYYRVVCAGMPSGAVQDNPTLAWQSWERQAKHRGYEDHQMGDAQTIHSARMAVATTRRAAREADVSEAGGEVGKGRWWIDAYFVAEDEEY